MKTFKINETMYVCTYVRMYVTHLAAVIVEEQEMGLQRIIKEVSRCMDDDEIIGGRLKGRM